MVWFIIVIVLLCMFVLIDVWYFVGVIFGSMQYRSPSLKPRTAEEFLEPLVLDCRVMFTDLDLYLHMNNARYSRSAEYGRLFFALTNGIDVVVKEMGATVVLTAITIRFRRELRLFQKYKLKTRPVYWTNSDVYFEHRFETGPNSFVNCIMYAQMRFVNVTVPDVIKRICNGKEVTSPDPPKDLLKWIEYVNSSSESLKSETKKS